MGNKIRQFEVTDDGPKVQLNSTHAFNVVNKTVSGAVNKLGNVPLLTGERGKLFFALVSAIACCGDGAPHTHTRSDTHTHTHIIRNTHIFTHTHRGSVL